MKTAWKTGIIAGLLVLAGCGNPETDRFSTGDSVIAIERKTGNGGTDFPYVMVETPGNSMWPILPYGTHLSVVTDEDEKDLGRDWATRKVLVHIEEGEHKGKTGTLTRWSLRKVK